MALVRGRFLLVPGHRGGEICFRFSLFQYLGLSHFLVFDVYLIPLSFTYNSQPISHVFLVLGGIFVFFIEILTHISSLPVPPSF